MSEERNPHHICTWGPEAECTDCEIRGLLICRMDYADLVQFLLLAFNFFIPAVLGMILGGYGVYLIGYAAFWIFFFGFFEIRVLCSHCPFYAERGFILHCPANYGLPKFWRYHPEPMNRWEKVGLLLGIAILFGYPLPFLVLGRQYALLTVAVFAVILWMFIMQRNVCSRCVNFSCPLNRVPKWVVDAYLQRNEVIGEAWETGGHQLG